LGTGFHRSKDPTSSVKALKEEDGPKDKASIPLDPPYHVTIIRHMCSTKNTQGTNTWTHINLCTVKWAQWDETESREV